jgi:uncharacterized membrane protein YbhN (UPF0104 family)
MLRVRHLLRRLWPVVGLLMLCLGVYLVSREVRHHGLHAVVQEVARIPAHRLAAAAACVVGSYLALTGFDTLGLLWAGHPLPWRRAAFASFVGLSIGHNIGLGGLGSGTLRWRVYSTWGLSGGQVARVVVFSGLTVALGLATLAAVVLLVRPAALGVAPPLAPVLGVVVLAGIVVWLAGKPLGVRPLRLGPLRLAPLSPRLAAAQLALGTANYLLEAGVLYQVLAAFQAPGYLALVGVFVAATVAGMASHAPGGLGVVEAVVLALLPGVDVIAALLAYRLLYFWIPGLVGAGCLVGFEWTRRRRTMRPAAAR